MLEATSISGRLAVHGALNAPLVSTFCPPATFWPHTARFMHCGQPCRLQQIRNPVDVDFLRRSARARWPARGSRPRSRSHRHTVR